MDLENISMAESEREEISKQIGALPNGTIKTINKNEKIDATYVIRDEQKSILMLPSDAPSGAMLNVNVPKESSSIRGRENTLSFSYKGQRYTVNCVLEYNIR